MGHYWGNFVAVSKSLWGSRRWRSRLFFGVFRVFFFVALIYCSRGEGAVHKSFLFTSICTSLISSKQSDFWVWVTAGTKLFTMVFGGWNHPQHDIYSLKSVWGLVHMTWTVIRYVQCLNSLKSPEAHTQSKVSFFLTYTKHWPALCIK